MKKGITMIIAITAIAIILTAMSGGTAAATDKNICNSLDLKGVGVIDITIAVDTSEYYSGLSLQQYAYTPSLGMHGPSYVEYTSSYDLEMYNVTEANQFSSIIFTENGNIENAKRSFALKNYMIGAAQGYKAQGNITQELEAYGDSTILEIDLLGKIEGKMKLVSKVVNLKTRAVQLSEISEFIGVYMYEWNPYVEIKEYPANEIDIDWLGCP